MLFIGFFKEINKEKIMKKAIIAQVNGPHKRQIKSALIICFGIPVSLSGVFSKICVKNINPANDQIPTKTIKSNPVDIILFYLTNSANPS